MGSNVFNPHNFFKKNTLKTSHSLLPSEAIIIIIFITTFWKAKKGNIKTKGIFSHYK